MTQDIKAVRIDAKTFQEPLGRLASTMAQLVIREGIKHIAGPPYAGADIGTMVRYAASIYNLLNYLNADERRKGDCYWYFRYGVTAMSLIRSLIDCLYNVTAILENVVENGPAYRKSGLKKTLDDLNEDYERYRGQEIWELFVEERRKGVSKIAEVSGFTMDEIRQQKMWPTLGTYVRTLQPGGALTEHQQFLKTFTLLNWRQYSALSHGAFEAFIGTLGAMPVGAYYVDDFLPEEHEEKLGNAYEMLLATHLGRSGTVLLCLLTEIQVYCRFEGHNVNERICKLWAALLPLFEANELYQGRYRKRMEESGISSEAGSSLA